MSNTPSPITEDGILAKQVSDWRKEVAHLNDLIAHATGDAPITTGEALKVARDALTLLTRGRDFYALSASTRAIILGALDTTEQVASAAPAPVSGSSEPPVAQGERDAEQFAQGVIYACARIVELFDQPTIAGNILTEWGGRLAHGCPEYLAFMQAFMRASIAAQQPAEGGEAR